MSSDSKPILRRQDVISAANLPLVRWDKNGIVVDDVSKAKAEIVESVDEVAHEAITAPTVKELESIREDAYNEGFEQGFASGMTQGHLAGHSEGHAEGLIAGQEKGTEQGLAAGTAKGELAEAKKNKEKLAVFEALTAAFKAQMPHEQAELEQALLSLSIRIARQIIRDELRAQPSHIAAVVHAAVQSLPNPDEKLTLSVNPSELAFVTSFAEKHWQLEGDVNVSVGGCKIKTQYSYVDYTLEHRFDAAVRHLMTQLGEDSAKASQSPLSEQPLIGELGEPGADLAQAELASVVAEAEPEPAVAEAAAPEAEPAPAEAEPVVSEAEPEPEPIVAEATAPEAEPAPAEPEPTAPDASAMTSASPAETPPESDTLIDQSPEADSEPVHE